MNHKCKTCYWWTAVPRGDPARLDWRGDCCVDGVTRASVQHRGAEDLCWRHSVLHAQLSAPPTQDEAGNSDGESRWKRHQDTFRKEQNSLQFRAEKAEAEVKRLVARWPP